MKSGKDLVFYRASKVWDLPGMAKFRGHFRAYGMGATPVDRSNSGIRYPIRIKSLFPLPQVTNFDKSYEEICDVRAVELLNRSGILDCPLYCFWSGGIDSTCVLVSLLRNATKAQLEHITVLLSEVSINEYPEFYRKYIRGKLKRQPSAMFPFLIGRKNLIVSGEHNDQLFGSDIIARAIHFSDFKTVMSVYDQSFFTRFYTDRMEGDAEMASLHVKQFERLKEHAPIRLRTNYDLFWWINFVLKWQTVYMRMLCFMSKRNEGMLNSDYLSDYYEPFFKTEDFQLWSMTNLDKRVKKGWNSYKWPAKDLIYDFTKDAEYRDNKLKIASLKLLIEQQSISSFVDDKFNFYSELEPSEFWEPENDFKS